jgi:hypothetical protein
MSSYAEGLEERWYLSGLSKGFVQGFFESYEETLLKLGRKHELEEFRKVNTEENRDMFIQAFRQGIDIGMQLAYIGLCDAENKK